MFLNIGRALFNFVIRLPLDYWISVSIYAFCDFKYSVIGYSLLIVIEWSTFIDSCSENFHQDFCRASKNYYQHWKYYTAFFNWCGALLMLLNIGRCLFNFVTRLQLDYWISMATKEFWHVRCSIIDFELLIATEWSTSRESENFQLFLGLIDSWMLKEKRRKEKLTFWACSINILFLL